MMAAQTALSRRLDTPRPMTPFEARLRAQQEQRRVRFERSIGAILQRDDLPSGAKLVAIAVGQLNRENPHRVTLGRIRGLTGYCDKALIRHLHILEESGVLTISHGVGTLTNRYAVMIPEPFSA